MTKKFILIVLLFAIVSGAAFAQHKYQASDMLLGIDFGMGLTANAFTMSSLPWPAANYALTLDLGLNYDYYIFPWLSFNTGIFAKTGLYLALKTAITEDDHDLMAVAKTPVCLTIPLTAHINVPIVNFLYLGAGITLNIPVSSYSVDELQIGDDEVSFGKKGGFFLGIPLDIGFDMVKPNKGGSRFIIRIAPELHSEGLFIPVGFMYQMHNFRIYSKK
jgi:hypothetical protein